MIDIVSVVDVTGSFLVFLVLAILIFDAAIICIASLTVLICLIGKLYSEFSGKENLLSKKWDEEIDLNNTKKGGKDE